MSKREIVYRELASLPEQDLDELLANPRSIKDAKSDATVPMLAAESSLAKDCLTPEEDKAWADL